MNEGTKKLIQAIPGLAIHIVVQKKNYSFTHGEIKTKRNYSLGGLYPEDAELSLEDKQENTTSSVCKESVWEDEPSAEVRNNLGNTLRIMPDILRYEGFEVMDEKLKIFHDRAKLVKVKLKANLPNGGVISSAAMKRAEEYMKAYNLSGWTLKVTAIKVSKDIISNGRKRSDGLYEIRQVLRTVYIDKKPSDAGLENIMNIILTSLTKPVVSEMSVTGSYLISTNKNGETIFRPTVTTNFSYQGRDYKETTSNLSVPPGAKRPTS